jgi:hypothetical protein
MKRILRRQAPLAALLGAFAVILAACTADFGPSAPKAPTAAQTEPSNLLGILGGDDRDSDSDGLLAGLLSNLSLHSCDSPDLGSVSKSIGRAGGVIEIGPHSLTVPAGALSRPVTITATARAGNNVKVDFQPHGLRFASRAVLRLSYAHCSGRPLFPKVVYVGDTGGLLTILELLPSLNDDSNGRVTARIRHFSGYAIAD